MSPLPPQPSWVAKTPTLEAPPAYSPAATPWRPAGLKPLSQSLVFLSQAPSSRPSSASTAEPRPSSARPSSGRSAPSRPPSAPAYGERPHSAPVKRPGSAPRSGRRRTPSPPNSRPGSGCRVCRPSSAPVSLRRGTEQTGRKQLGRPGSAVHFRPSRPSSAARPLRPSSAPAERHVISSHGRRYKVRQMTGGEASRQSHQTSLDSMANQSKLTIYTDHGSSDEDVDEVTIPEPEAEEAEASYVQYISARSKFLKSKPEEVEDPEVEAAEAEADKTANSEDSSDLKSHSMVSEAWSTSKVEKKSGQVSFGILEVSVSERPLYAELRLGTCDEEAQCTSNVVGRWPPLAEKLSFDVDDFRVEQLLSLSFWTSVGEQSPSKPRCVACGKMMLTEQLFQGECQVKITLDVHLNNGQLQRGLAVLHMEVFPEKPQLVIYGHGDALCSRSLSLFTRFKRRRFRHIQETTEVDSYEDRLVDVESRCWDYLEHRFETLKIKRQQCKDRVRAAEALRAGPMESSMKPQLPRVSSEQAMRLQRLLRSVVKGTYGSKALAENEENVFKAEELNHFLEQTLRAPPLSSDDDAALRRLLCVDGHVQLQDFRNFLEHGITVVPPPRVIYPDEQRARDILKDLFPNFLAKEQQREVELTPV